MKYLVTTNGTKVLLDDKDYERFCSRVWHLDKTGYVQTCWRSETSKKTTRFLHRLILDSPKGRIIDHINGNKLDNRKDNLRLCNTQQNTWNAGKCSPPRLSRFKGVTPYITSGKVKGWRARIRKDYVLGYIGIFRTEEQAALAYDMWAVAEFGTFARTNFALAI